MKKTVIVLVVLVLIVAALVVANILQQRGPKPGTVLDEAKTVGRAAESFPGSDEDYFHAMDYGITEHPEQAQAELAPFLGDISPEEAVRHVARGRNNWIVWTAGNDRLWDELSRRSFGNLDLLKTLSSHPDMSYSRDNRWQYLGLVNEPCFKKPTAARGDRYGLWLDERVEGPDCPPDPFEDDAKYPGVAIGARGQNIPVGSYYGYASGIVGLRLFPNPAFDAKAEADWDPERYYTDPKYYNRKDLIKPYRVGMSCGFCHVGPNPSNPPEDPENPKWENLNSNPGAQYFWIDRIFMWKPDASNFIYQLFHTSRPGALDTSLVSSDQINNPRTMNAVYNLLPRLEMAQKWGQETLAGGGLDNAQFNNYVDPSSPLNAFFQAPDTVFTPRVLKDGADSVGALGALNRVFVNIGLFSEEWLLHFIPLIGGPDITPIKIADAEKNSSYWRATESQTPDTALFFLATAKPDDLAAAPGGEQYLTADSDTLDLGKDVFAERCARCHSSKLPEQAFTDFFQAGCNGPNYLKCWNDYWLWTKTEEFQSAMREIVHADDFLDHNFLSTDQRIPVTLLQTNACSPLATNAIEDNIWDNFSSRSYKDLPSVGNLLVHNPFTGEPYEIPAPAGGRGYTRVPSLISLWSTAPYLLNNSLGPFEWSGSVDGRVSSFEDSITQLLWPERRDGDRSYRTTSGKEHPGIIDTTTETSYLKVSAGFLPPALARLSGLLDQFLPNVFGMGGDVQLGPIPKGTPVNLLSNIDLQKKAQVIKLVLKIKHDLEKLPRDATDEEAREVFRNLGDDLLAVNKCPDFVVNRGHYFGTDFLPESEDEPGLRDEQKLALIEFLKTF